MHGVRPRRPVRIATLVATSVALAAAFLVALSAALATPGGATARTLSTAATTAPPGQTGSLTGPVTAPRAAGSTPEVPVADVRVTATAADGTTYATTTTAAGWYDLESLPAGSYALAATEPGATPTTAHVTVRVGRRRVAGLRLPAPAATVTGVVRASHEGAVPGIPVSVNAPAGSACPTAPACGTAVISGVRGRYTLHIPAGTYSLSASDAGVATAAQTVTARAGATIHIAVALPVAPVPADTAPAHAARDLRRLDAERVADRLPAGLTLSRRWSAECAAHDAYQRLNAVLSPTENPASAGASIGGAWAGLNSDLAEGEWTGTASPWEDAPIHLLALLTPSLKVVGIDDDAGFQCVTTYPGMVRAPGSTDRVFTYPAAGARGVEPSEVARESPFVPGQFVGLPTGRATGRELFVYLDLAHQLGQAPVHVLAARLVASGHRVALRTVDAETPTVGRYLAGAILIPVKPLRHHTRYTATVKVQDRSGTLSRRWSFTTG